MNYALRLSLKTERHLEALVRDQQSGRASTSDTQYNNGGGNGNNESTAYGIQYQNRDGDENVVWGRSAGSGAGTTTPRAPSAAAGTPEAIGHLDLEERALALAIEEEWEESGRQWRPWAANGRATRIGEIVLIVDADTVVPEDCLRDAAREMAESPMVAIIQHESGEYIVKFDLCMD